MIVIDNHDEVFQSMLPGTEGGFPHAALIRLSVADEHENPVCPSIHPGGQGHANPNRKPMPKRAGAGLHSGSFTGFWMASQHRSESANPVQLFLWKESLFGKNDIQGQTSMPLAKNKTVAVFPTKLGGVVP